MYNRFIPDSGPDQWGEPAAEEAKSEIGSLLGGALKQSGLAGIWKHLRLSQLDAGDILVLVIAALLILDKKDIDLGIALILVFLLGFGEEKTSS